jgi:hypothetical protein
VSITLGGVLLLRLPTVPYNIKQLAGDYPLLPMGALAGVLLVLGVVPMWFALMLRHRPSAFGRRFVPLTLAVGSVMFLALAITVPTEAIDDIVGTPVLGLSASLERWIRFVGLVAGPIAAWALGACLALGRQHQRGLGAGAAIAAGVMGASYMLVVPLAATSNIWELLRDRGGPAAAPGLVAYFVLTGLVFGTLARSVVSTHLPRALVVATLVLPLSIPPAWQAFVAASNPRLDKYGQVFSARQFLLSPDRDHYLDDRTIFLRFAVGQIALTLVLAAGAATVLAYRPFERLPETRPALKGR